jgi:hypothetical protein
MRAFAVSFTNKCIAMYTVKAYGDMEVLLHSLALALDG